MIEAILSPGEVQSLNFGFATFFPAGYEVESITARHHDAVWPTVRYEFSGDLSGRVKQFFMDWFYYGFPKNLMSSLVDSYSMVEARMGRNPVYYGRDYKGIEAATTAVNGTHIEVEFFAGDRQEREDFMNSLSADSKDLHRVSGLRYHERGYHTMGNPGQWYEDLRISRLRWVPLDDPRDSFGNAFRGSSEGSLVHEGKTVQRYRIYQESNFRRVISVDVWRKDTTVDHVRYRIRKGGQFFDIQVEKPALILYKSSFGPAMMGITHNGLEGVVSVSGPVGFDEAASIYDSALELIRDGFRL